MTAKKHSLWLRGLAFSLFYKRTSALISEYGPIENVIRSDEMRWSHVSPFNVLIPPRCFVTQPMNHWMRRAQGQGPCSTGPSSLPPAWALTCTPEGEGARTVGCAAAPGSDSSDENFEEHHRHPRGREDSGNRRDPFSLPDSLLSLLKATCFVCSHGNDADSCLPRPNHANIAEF